MASEVSSEPPTTTATSDSLQALDDLWLADSRAASEGFRQGRRAGRRKEEVEGTALGLKKGHEVGSEIGFYLGFAQAWCEQLEASDKLKKSEERALKSLAKLRHGSEAFPAENIKEEDVLEALEELRARFKLCCQLLQIQSEKSQEGGISW